MMKKFHKPEIQGFIKKNVQKHRTDIAIVMSRHFGFSRQTATKYLLKEVKKGTIIRTGKNRWIKYFPADGDYVSVVENNSETLSEDQVWKKSIKPLLQLRLPKNIYNIVNYGFSEIYNNAIDHSNANRIFSDVEIKDQKIVIRIIDNGIGIFQKIQEALDLTTTRESVLHLSKGKFTTDPKKHSGQGIFFTSRMFDTFYIFSAGEVYVFKKEGWLLSDERKEIFGKGTMIMMELDLRSTREAKQVFDKYSSIDEGFYKTKISVALSGDPDDPHVSRSQARRMMVSVDKFKEVILDFESVTFVGQAFADEIFRVFQNEHPQVKIVVINATADVNQMIQRTLNTNQSI